MNISTHELARALEVLVRILRNSPDVPLSQSSLRLSDITASDPLAHISALSSLDKAQLVHLINVNDLPINYRKRDAARDIAGKLMKYLSAHPEETQRVSRSMQHGDVPASDALIAAIQSLLRE